ncbi:MAG: hypothetical protein CR957_00425 [Gammaproteobacteria bacterium]|nr:MAG: hypothetical protein CR957_00425 [Gammaproteobacteria bacterium]
MMFKTVSYKKQHIGVKAAKQPAKAVWLALFVVGLLSGCASTDNLGAGDSPAPKQWQLNGKIGLIYPDADCSGQGDCRTKSDQGKISWQQQTPHYRITLSDPFNRVVMSLAGDEQNLRATSPDQPPIDTTPNEFVAVLAHNADNPALSTLSPAWLSYWVTGRPAPDSTVSQKTGNAFTQAGYRVSARKWQQTPLGHMPTLIVVKKDHFTLRLAVQSWQALK